MESSDETTSMPEKDNADNTTTTLDGINSKLPLVTTTTTTTTTTNEPETSAVIGIISTNSTQEIISTEALSLVLISQVQPFQQRPLQILL